MNQILTGDNIAKMRQLPAEWFHLVVTSPPYYGLRSYLPDNHPFKALEFGQEKLPDCMGWTRGENCGECYICKLVLIFREVARVLRSDGVLFLNLGDSYANDSKWGGESGWKFGNSLNGGYVREKRNTGFGEKNLMMIPARAAMALQADGWTLRVENIWHKPNSMPSSVKDRPAVAHEPVYMLTKEPHYFYDRIAVQELANYDGREKTSMDGSSKYADGYSPATEMNGHNFHKKGHERWVFNEYGERIKNKRTVWTIPTSQYKEAHYAVFPEKLAEIPILCGTSEKGCCAECGAPVERIIVKEFLPEDFPRDQTKTAWRKFREAEKEGTLSFEHLEALRAVGLQDGENNELKIKRWADKAKEILGSYAREFLLTHEKTSGWQPTCPKNCSAKATNTVPCRVLDPFGGSGTVAQVADKLGREWTVIDIDERNLEFAKKRTIQPTFLKAV